jgi:hypothetical protein
MLVAPLHPCLPAASPVRIDVAELPQPPPAIRRLLDRGPIEWESGDRQDSDAAEGRPKLSAETKYRVSYSYRSRVKWKVNQPENQLTISVRFTRVDWEVSHRIWFLKRPPLANFWSDKIVLHELDHLSISSDPRLAKRFEQELQKASVFDYAVKASDVVDKRFVERLVKNHADRIFQNQADLIAIRYQELDRVTKHGQRPVPQNSPTAKWLAESAQVDN